MPTSQVSSPEPSAWRLGVILLTATALGLMSEEIAFGLTNPERWVSDFVVGVSLVGLGLVAFRFERGTGSLLIASGLSWWLANVFSPVQYLHRGFLLHTIATYPGWRTSRDGAFLLILGYIGVSLLPVAGTELGTALYGIAVVTVAARRRKGAVGRRRRQRSMALFASIALAVGTTGGALIRTQFDRLTAAGAALLGYQLMLIVAAALLVVGLRAPPPEVIADLVIELEGRSGTIRDTLARLLGDPRLTVGFEDSGGYVDSHGQAIELPPVGSDRVATRVAHNTGRSAVIVHDRSLLTDGLLMDAVSAVARLSASNAQLNLAASAQVSDLAASRRRLLTAEDDERRRLSQRLHKGVDRRLDQVEASLSVIANETSVDVSTRDAASMALEQLRLARQDIVTIAQGLDPWQDAANLAEALGDLAERSSIPVEVVLADRPILAESASSVYYVCAEGVTNALKHSHASHIRIEVRDGLPGLTVVVADDGVGGARLAGGTGLGGLADRLADLGGQIALESEKGSGTTLVAHIPGGVA